MIARRASIARYPSAREGVPHDARTRFGATDLRNRIPRFAAAAREGNQALVELLRTVGAWIVPLLGTRKLARLKEDLGALEVHLTVEDVAELDRASSAIGAQGARYPEEILKLSGR